MTHDFFAVLMRKHHVSAPIEALMDKELLLKILADNQSYQKLLLEDAWLVGAFEQLTGELHPFQRKILRDLPPTTLKRLLRRVKGKTVLEELKTHHWDTGAETMAFCQVLLNPNVPESLSKEILESAAGRIFIERHPDGAFPKHVRQQVLTQQPDLATQLHGLKSSEARQLRKLLPPHQQLHLLPLLTHKQQVDLLLKLNPNTLQDHRAMEVMGLTLSRLGANTEHLEDLVLINPTVSRIYLRNPTNPLSKRLALGMLRLGIQNSRLDEHKRNWKP